MKRLLALLLLVVSPVFAQEITYDVTQYTGTAGVPSLENLQQNGGTPLNLGDDSSTNRSLGFNFMLYNQSFSSAFISNNGVISFQNPINGCCGGYDLSGNGNEYGIFAFQTDLLNINSMNPYVATLGEEGSRRFVVGWYDMPIFANSSFRSTFEITLFEGSNNILLNYGDISNGGRQFTAGIKGSNADGYELVYFGNDGNSLDYTAYLFNSSYVPPPPSPPEFLYWDRLSGEYQTFTLTEPGVVRYGANGVYAYLSLQAGTYECGNSLFGDPIGGVVKSCELGSNEPPVVAVDCAVNPLDPSCIIDSINDIVNEPMLAEEVYTESDDEEEDLVAEEEIFFAAEESFEDSYEQGIGESLEELLADEAFEGEEDEDSIEVAASATPIKEMVDEEKASTLSDSISKDVLESALSVAAAAETNGSSNGSSSESSSSKSSNVGGGVSESAVASTESNSSSASIDSSGQESSAAGDASMELLETGRVLGQEALSVTMAATEASATDSLSQAESIAQTSSSDSMTASSATVETINSIEIENVIETVTATESSTDTSVEMVGMTENTSETGNVSDGSDMFASIENNPSAASAQEAEDVALAVVNNSIASGEQKTFEDETNTDAEVTNAMVDPALAMANTFNQAPSMMSLEFLGIVKPVEEKSDAERSAEKVIAANKEQQDEINKNYMDADQSGIVAAIAVDADVSSYLSARLMDNNTWYKPEDIYKGVVIKDNARGSYFLEKGNTDTYKKMIEEQYK